MKLELERIFLGADYTIGKLFIDGVYECDTLEDTVREFKIKHETAIPKGTYKVIITMSQRFQRLLPLLVNVPGFDGIRIHPGNTKADTSGCLLVGQNKVKGMVINSRATFNRLFAKLLLAENIDITITE
jgi:hypothetical protein